MAVQSVTQEISSEALVIDEIIARARRAQEAFEKNGDQELYDNAALAAAWAVMEPSRNKELAEMAVELTGLGNVKDKITKNHRKTLGLLRDIKGVQTSGVIEKNEETGITQIARPVGVIGAVVPSTNPVATPVNNIVNALKCGNAIILSPSPKGVAVCEKLLGYVYEEFDKIGIDRDLVQMVPAPSSKAKTQRLMELSDLLVVTGSQDNVRRAYSSGTPAIGVGAGNVTVIVDETADIQSAAQKITASKCFDNATSCSSENVVIVVDEIYETFVEALELEGGRFLDQENADKLRAALFQDGHLNRHMIARDLDVVVEVAGLDIIDASTAKFLLLEGQGVGPDYPESGEKLSLVTTIYRAENFLAAKSLATEILNHQGAGHSIGIHTNDKNRPFRLGAELPTCRVIVNQAHCFATGGSFDNGLPFSLSMGCGSWGGNSIDENFHYKHLMNITKIVKPIEPNEPSLDEIFNEYWQKTDGAEDIQSDLLDLSNKSIKDVIDTHAETKPDDTFLIDPHSKKKVSFKDLKIQVSEIAKQISETGIEKGETVGYALGNNIHSAISILGIMYGGYLATAINLVAGKTTIKFIVDHSGCRTILLDDKNFPLMEELQNEFNEAVTFFNISDHDFDNQNDIHDENRDVDGPAVNDPGLLMYTSGTTGLPKGVVLSHKNLLAGGGNTYTAHCLRTNDRALCTLPLYHINGLCVTLLAPLISGGSVVIPNRFSVSEFWPTLEAMECSWFSVVPTQISYLLQDAELNNKKTDTSLLRFGRSASAPLAPETQAAFEKLFNVPIIETMGLTETAAQILSNPLPPAIRKIGSPGIAYGNEVKIVDANEREVNPGFEGEVIVKGPNVMMEYYNNEKATKDTFTSDGWLRTGDLGRMDKDGYVFITGRLKELIIKGGENIAPREIDDVLYGHPDVVEAAAFARPSRNYGQTVEAGVSLKEGTSTSAIDLIIFCKEKIGDFKCPDKIHILSELPKGASGKIQRLKLSDLLYNDE